MHDAKKNVSLVWKGDNRVKLFQYDDSGKEQLLIESWINVLFFMGIPRKFLYFKKRKSWIWGFFLHWNAEKAFSSQGWLTFRPSSDTLELISNFPLLLFSSSAPLSISLLPSLEANEAAYAAAASEAAAAAASPRWGPAHRLGGALKSSWLSLPPLFSQEENFERPKNFPMLSLHTVDTLLFNL